MKFFAVLILFFAFALNAQENTQEKPQNLKEIQRVAILELKDYTQGAVTESERMYLSNLIRQSLNLLPKNQYAVMTQENIISLLPEGKVLEDCLKDCEVLIGRELGANYIITGEIVRFGQALRISLKLHESKSGILKGSDNLSGLKIEELENVIKGATLGLFQELLPQIKAQVNQLKKNFIKEQVIFEWPKLVDPTSANLSPFIQTIDLPDQIDIDPSFDLQTMNLDQINSKTIDLFAQAFSQENDFDLSAKQKLETWQKLLSSQISSQMKTFAQQRIQILQKVVWAEQYFWVAQFDQGYAHPLDKIKKWESLLGIESLKKQAQIRIAEWQKFLENNQIPYYHLSKIYQKLLNDYQKRSTQMQADWDKLSRLSKLVSIPKADQRLWVNRFIETYGWHRSLNPYIDQLIEKQSLANAKVIEISDENQLFLKKLNDLLDAFPIEFWQTHQNVIKETITPKGIEQNQRFSAILEPLFPQKIMLNELIFNRIDGGAFMMGKDPSRYVGMKAFYISESEITVHDYLSCVNAGFCIQLRTSDGCHWQKIDQKDLPVNCITWQEARSFAKWIGGDLPTQAQWEYAAVSQDLCDVTTKISEWTLDSNPLDREKFKNIRACHREWIRSSRLVYENAPMKEIGFRVVLPITPSFQEDDP